MIKDSSWVRQGNLLPKNSIRSEDVYYRNYTSGFYKFTDTTLGGNFAINCPPQFCEHADPVPPRYLDIFPREKDMPYASGMGRWYGEKIDDSANLLHMRFGIPVYNSLSSFFGNFYNSDDSRMVRTGRGWSIGSFIGKALGWAFSLRMLPFIMIGTAVRWFAQTTSTRFAYLKPMMGHYWKYVNDFANTVTSNMEMTAGAAGTWMRFAERTGMTPGASMKLSKEDAEKIAKDEFNISEAEQNMYSKMLPDIYKTRDDKNKILTGIDIYSVATRAQRLANAFNEGVNQVAKQQSSNANGVMSGVRAWMNNGAKGELSSAQTPSFGSTEEFLQAYYREPSGQINAPTGSDAETDGTPTGINTNPANNPDKTNPTTPPTDAEKALIAQGAGDQSLLVSSYESVKDYFSLGNLDGSWATFRGAQKDGSAWVTFRIDGRNSVSESFSNSTRRSTVGEAFNSTSAANRNMRVSLADGNLADWGLSAVTDFIKDIASGAAQSLQISGLGALAGNAFVDIPEHFDESSANFQKMSFDLQLRAAYGNDLCRFQTEILPTIMLLSGMLPRSEGTQAYGSPFIVEWYCRGRGQCRFGIIESLEIERGVSNAPWSPDGKYRGINVRVTIKDLSSVVHMPMNEVSGWSVINPTSWNKLLFPQDSSFSDYTAVLASCGMSEQVYKIDKLKRNWAANMSAFSKWFSVSSRVNALFDGNRGQLLSALSRGDRG